ncbi:MAG: NUDIX domain-containing protein [Candidatus Melainabacteria bacterium]|nr:NUDIX domain-containing protein [Candidatus Melainabacteria bacterium]
MRKTFTAGGLVLNKKGQVLIANQNGNSWSLPKGHIDEGETKLEAAIREIYEETGIRKLQFVKELGFYERYKIGLNSSEEDKSELKNISMFLFKTEEENLKPKDPTNPEAIWVEKKKVAELLTHKKDKEFFLGVIKELPSLL